MSLLSDISVALIFVAGISSVEALLHSYQHSTVLRSVSETVLSGGRLGLCYQNSGRCARRSVSCWLVNGSGTSHTFAHVRESTHKHSLTLAQACTLAQSGIGIRPLPSSCPWAWQSGHGRYQREGEAWKQRSRLWVRSVCSCESAFVGDKMAMSEQLETEGGKSLLLTSCFFVLSHCWFGNKTL